MTGPNETTDALCSDNIDNDGNGYADCMDYSCSRNPDITVCGERAPEDTDAACSDMVDNDGDGHTDCDDYDCSRSMSVTVCAGVPTGGATGGAMQGPSESDDATCSDMMDNDCDGYVDCMDYSCSRHPMVTVCGARDPEDTDALCSDGVDNDNDGFTDCDDYDCSRSMTVTVCAQP